MRIRNPRDLGLAIREQRRGRGWSQAQLADRVAVCRHWVMEIERGKPGTEVGLVLRALAALQLTCELRENFSASLSAPPVAFQPGVPVPDLKQVLIRTTGSQAALAKSRPSRSHKASKKYKGKR